MATPDNVHHMPGNAPPDAAAVADAARAAYEEEFQVGHRLETKIQYQFALTAGWFAITQTLAIAVLNVPQVTRFWKVLTLLVALVAGLAIFIAIMKTFNVWKLRPERGISVEHLKEWAKRVHKRDPQVPGELAMEYAVALQSRRESNDKRVTAVGTSFRWCGISVAVTALELGFALTVRMLSTAL